MSSINIDNYIDITNNVVGSISGQGAMSGNLLTGRTDVIPNGSVRKYYNAVSVGDDFTYGSPEYAAAQLYFASYINSRKSPDFLLLSGFAAGQATSPYLVTGQLSQTDINAIVQLSAATLTLPINGTPVTATIDFTSVSNNIGAIALAIQSALRTAASISSINVYDNNDNTLTIITNQTGIARTIGFGTDSSLSPLIHALSTSTGASITQGSAGSTVTQLLNMIFSQNRNWVGLSTITDYTAEVGLTTYMAIVQWIQANAKNFAFVPWVNTVAGAITLKGLVDINNYTNITVLKGDYRHAASILSLGASTDYDAVNGRLNFAFKSFAGLPVTVDNDSDFNTLKNAAITFYGKNAGRNDQVLYSFFFPCAMTGVFLTLANFYNQVWLNDALQVNLITLLTSINNLPNNPDGMAMVSTSLKDPINTARNNGVIQVGNSFNNQIKLLLVQQAGVDITPALASNGYFLQILQATPTQRAAQEFGDINFWYTNGQSVLYMNLVNTLVL